MVAKLSAIFFLSVGIYALSGKLDVKKMLKSFDESPGLTIMSGFAMIVIGGLLIEYHNIWVKDWPVLVTILGWASMIKGVTFITCPRIFSGLEGTLKDLKAQPLGYIIIVVGLIYGYFGFLA